MKQRINRSLADHLDRDFIDRYFYYSHSQGDLLWAWVAGGYDKVNERRVNTPAGRMCTDGYRKLMITENGERYGLMVSRIVWFINTGRWPTGNLLFLDGDGNNCAFDNLTEVCPKQAHLYCLWTKRLQNVDKGIKLNRRGYWQFSFRNETRQYDSFHNALVARRRLIQERLFELEMNFEGAKPFAQHKV